MRISGLPKASSQVFKTHSKNPAKVWNRKFKKLSDSTLVKTVQAILNAPKNSSTDLWKFAGVAISELYIRNWGKTHRDKLEDLRIAISNHSKHCFSAHGYALETAGLIDPNAKKSSRNIVYHPYAYDKFAKKVVTAWENHKHTKKSLEAYLDKHLTKKEKAYLRNHAIEYVRPHQQSDYEVTFHGDEVRIGGKVPKNGWYIYVLGGEPTTLLASRKIKGRFHHTSFFHGAPVVSAGEIKIKDGKLKSAFMRSGHYKPTEVHGEYLREYLKQEKNMGSIAAMRLYIQPFEN
ncbi:MAG: hypothetical protein LLF94_01555 [Chlamydiales bacterium]|nr:hypothetical protein [Chlamydiales bacterium]